jgi:rhodanese-related sulfurtransferase
VFGVIRRLTPAEVDLASAAVIDVREFPEFAALSIPGSRLVPAATLEREAQGWSKHDPIALVCRSGRRATDAATRLALMGFSDLFVLEGGIEAWKAAGLPVQSVARKLWSLERQVRVMAGGMVLVSAILGLILSPWFFGWTLFVGAGLTFAGISDICLMATALGKLPWNRPRSCDPVREEVCR